MGRIGDEHALEALRAGLHSDYRSIRAHCARVLGALNDQQIIPLLLARVAEESDIGLQMAFASTLGNLRAAQAMQPLLALLAAVHNVGTRRELALFLARIMGHEQHFITLLREIRGDMGTAVPQTVTALAKKVIKSQPDQQKLANTRKACADAFAHQQLDERVVLLSQAIRLWPDTAVSSPAHTIIHVCADHLDQYGITHEEYITGKMKAYWVGKDPFAIRPFVTDMLYGGLPPHQPSQSASAPPFGSVAWAVSGVEMALCDLVGKALNTPVYNLLGGKYRKRLLVGLDCSLLSDLGD